MSTFSYLLSQKGKLYTFGDNRYHQLGTDSKWNTKPQVALTDENIKFTSCGKRHAMIYYKNGDLYGIGSNSFGELSLGRDGVQFYKFTFIMNNPNIKSIHCSTCWSLIHIEDGDRTGILVCGNNVDDKLGFGGTDNRYWFTQLDFFNHMKIKLIAVGEYHTLIYTVDGQLYGFGNILRKRSESPILIMTDKNISMISCGHWHSAIYKNNGELYTFGTGYSGQLGLGDRECKDLPELCFTDPTIKLVVCGADRTILYKNNGDCYVCGDNRYGSLGLQTEKDGMYMKHALSPIFFTNDKDIVSFECKEDYTLYTKSNGDVYIFGHQGTINDIVPGNKLEWKPVFLLNLNDKELEVVSSSGWTYEKYCSDILLSYNKVDQSTIPQVCMENGETLITPHSDNDKQPDNSKIDWSTTPRCA
jgi:alpha-tubulin suppressor-like RCC1 family protein